jgi:hypothetical protein
MRYAPDEEKAFGRSRMRDVEYEFDTFFRLST